MKLTKITALALAAFAACSAYGYGSFEAIIDPTPSANAEIKQKAQDLEQQIKLADKVVVRKHEVMHCKREAITLTGEWQPKLVANSGLFENPYSPGSYMCYKLYRDIKLAKWPNSNRIIPSQAEYENWTSLAYALHEDVLLENLLDVAGLKRVNTQRSRENTARMNPYRAVAMLSDWHYAQRIVPTIRTDLRQLTKAITALHPEFRVEAQLKSDALESTCNSAEVQRIKDGALPARLKEKQIAKLTASCQKSEAKVSSIMSEAEAMKLTSKDYSYLDTLAQLKAAGFNWPAKLALGDLSKMQAVEIGNPDAKAEVSVIFEPTYAGKTALLHFYPLVKEGLVKLKAYPTGLLGENMEEAASIASPDELMRWLESNSNSLVGAPATKEMLDLVKHNSEVAKKTNLIVSPAWLVTTEGKTVFNLGPGVSRNVADANAEEAGYRSQREGAGYFRSIRSSESSFFQGVVELFGKDKVKEAMAKHLLPDQARLLSIMYAAEGLDFKLMRDTYLGKTGLLSSTPNYEKGILPVDDARRIAAGPGEAENSVKLKSLWR